MGVIRRLVKENKKADLVDTNQFFLQDNQTHEIRKSSFEYDE